MPVEMIIASCVTGLLAVLAYFQGYRRSARRYDIIREVPTIAAKDLPGLGAAMVEVKGDVRVNQPMISDLARIPCVIFDAKVVEHWTTTRTTHDSKGRSRTQTNHHSETRYSNSVYLPFRVHDDTGYAVVQPDGAVVDMLDGLELAGIREPLPESPACHITTRHFGGHLRYHEEVLPVEQWVYVLGQVNDEHQIAAPKDIDRPFVISYRSEDSLLKQARWGKRIYGCLAIVLFLATFVILGVASGVVDGVNRQPYVQNTPFHRR